MIDLEQYATHVAKSKPVTWIGGQPWRVARRILEPIAMPHALGPVDRAEVRAAMRQYKAPIARWTDAWDTDPCEWWWVCCANPHYDLDKLDKRGRRDVRAGLRRCHVKRVDAEWVSQYGYDVFAAAYDRYEGESQPPIPERFASNIRRLADLPPYEWWACWAGDDLAAIAICIVLQNAVNLSTLKSHPAYLKAMPNNALIYTLTQYYLTERSASYVTDGSRTLLHETQFQDFLERRLGYRRVYCPLRAELSVSASLALKTGAHRWGRYVGLSQVAPGAMAKLQATARLAGIARACKPRAPGNEPAG